MGVWVWVSPLEAGVPLRGEAGGTVEGLCEKILAGKLHPQRNKRKGNNSRRWSSYMHYESLSLHLIFFS